MKELKDFKIEPTPSDAKIIICQASTMASEKMKKAELFCRYARRILPVVQQLGLEPSTDRWFDYCNNPSEILEDYKAACIEGVKPILIRAAIDGATAEFERVTEGVNMVNNYANQVPRRWIVSAPTAEEAPIIYDYEMIEAECVEYLEPKELPLFDRHRLICELMTDFFAGSVTQSRDIQDYFNVDENGVFTPSLGGAFGLYPPQKL